MDIMGAGYNIWSVQKKTDGMSPIPARKTVLKALLFGEAHHQLKLRL